MRILGKLSLFLVVLTFPPFLPSASKIVWCSRQALGADVKPFGSNGQDGSNAKTGQNGGDSDSLTIFADGSQTTLNLAGQDGLNGENGGNGVDALCSSQPQDASSDLQAPDGGNGGNGGDGGDGGNGGSLTIYSTNPANLKQIYVNAIGGKGGQPGQGGVGGKGCNCAKPYWTLVTCTGKPGDSDYSCSTREFRCRDGQDGRNGSSGRKGREGGLGKLTLVNLNKPLVGDQPTATVAMSDLKEKGYILSRNQWETRSGAASLFAPGSAIAEQYLALVERVERSFLLIWNAPQSFSQFAEQKLTLSLEDQGISVKTPDEVWIEATTQEKSEVTELVVYNAILKSEATRLKNEGLSGNGSNLQLTLVDLAEQSNLVATDFEVRYRITRSDPRFRPISDYSTRYEGKMPPELISLDGNRFTLNIGQLAIDPNDLKSGLGVEIELVANRSFAGYSTEQKIIVRDIIGPFK